MDRLKISSGLAGLHTTRDTHLFNTFQLNKLKVNNAIIPRKSDTLSVNLMCRITYYTHTCTHTDS